MTDKLRDEILLTIINAATDLCEEIRANGTHETWKALAHTLDALEEADATAEVARYEDNMRREGERP